jgi:hypothetical protein
MSIGQTSGSTSASLGATAGLSSSAGGKPRSELHCWQASSGTPSRGRRARDRRGVAVLVVMAVIAIALATAYSLLRSQATVIQIQANTNQRTQARQAAVTGLLVAMQKMSVTGWSGVNTTLTGALSNQDSYTVSFTAGDPTLATNDPNQPYRVTLVSTGYSANVLQSGQQASYRTRAVMRLVAKQLGQQPTNWPTMLQNVVYQNGSGKLVLNPPCQMQGPLLVQGGVQLGQDYLWSASAEQRYLGDLNVMRQAQLPDNRPLVGNISLPTSATDSTTLALLTTQLGLTTTDIQPASSVAIPLPNLLTTYQVYPGGPVYNVGQVPSTISRATFAPDPVTNPLGIFFSGSDVTIGNNVTITGTLISGGAVNITGAGVSFVPFNLPSLAGSAVPVRLPAIVANGYFHCASGVSASITGVVIAGGAATIDPGPQSNGLALTGHLIAGGDITIHGRSEWQLSASMWNTLYTAFQAQLTLPTRVFYFPTYLSAFGLNSNPLLTIKPDPTLLLNQWQDLSGPIYVPASGDGGLRWELLSWTDNI